ncbi:MAG: hypothetical protein Q7S28_04060 [bacterium]|nr:hypothetical protein [bacterium]
MHALIAYYVFRPLIEKYMRLSCDKREFEKLSRKELIPAIKERRAVIRASRDAKLDDRCWLDDYPIWLMLDDTPPEPTKPPPHEEAMARCKEFYEHCREEDPDPKSGPTIFHPARWDEDINLITHANLVEALVTLQEAIKAHREIKERPRSSDDYRQLYNLLPENVPADFRLPSHDEFLGEAKAPSAGCPAFWRSHAHCTRPCDLHRWGPCN